MTSDTTLYYVYDPMCSWCWGFRPVWDRVKPRLAGRLEIVYVLGGLAPENHEPMPEEMRAALQQTWRRVAEVCGVSFNFDFWTRNTPMRSTYPACKAALVARDYGKEVAMYERIQNFYYLEAGNPSEYANLYALAGELGLPEEAFIERIHSAEIEQRFLEERMFAERLGARGFPSLILAHGGETTFIQHSYTSVDENVEKVEALLNA
jgi:putative protein-disulfide isomerase